MSRILKLTEQPQVYSKQGFSQLHRTYRRKVEHKAPCPCNGEGKSLAFVLTEAPMSDYNGAKLLLNSLPHAQELLADRGYDAGWFREALSRRGITLCIPYRKQPVFYDNTSIGADSRTGVGLPCAMIVVPTHSCWQYALHSQFLFIPNVRIIYIYD